MTKLRLCLLIFVVCSVLPFQAVAIPFEAGAFTTVSFVWERMIQSPEPVDLNIASFEIVAPLPPPEEIIYTSIEETNKSALSFLAVEQEMLTVVEIPNGDENPGTGSSGNTPVPEPSTLLLLGSGLAGLAWFGRKRKKE